MERVLFKEITAFMNKARTKGYIILTLDYEALEGYAVVTYDDPTQTQEYLTPIYDDRSVIPCTYEWKRD